jgi:chemotaxis protein CheD
LQITVTISDAKASATPGDSLVTYSLGSCVGVALYDRSGRVGGLLHFQLPTASTDTHANPFMFADTGLDALVGLMVRGGADKRRITCKLAGGAKMFDDGGVFDIGRRNHTAIRKALWRHGILIDAEDCGGSVPRTMTLRVDDGGVTLKRNGETVDL